MNVSISVNHNPVALPLHAANHPDILFGEDVPLFNVDLDMPVIIGRGEREDIAARLTIEGGRDWRRLDRLERRFVQSERGV